MGIVRGAASAESRSVAGGKVLAVRARGQSNTVHADRLFAGGEGWELNDTGNSGELQWSEEGQAAHKAYPISHLTGKAKANKEKRADTMRISTKGDQGRKSKKRQLSLAGVETKEKQRRWAQSYERNEI